MKKEEDSVCDREKKGGTDTFIARLPNLIDRPAAVKRIARRAAVNARPNLQSDGPRARTQTALFAPTVRSGAIRGRAAGHVSRDRIGDFPRYNR